MMSLYFGTDPRLEFSPVCKSLIGVNLVIFALGRLGDVLHLASISSETLLMQFALFPGTVMHEGSGWALGTYMFLHANLLHISFNMIGLYLLGPDVEQALGSRRFLGFYLLSGLLGGLGFLYVSYGLQGNVHPCVGASGAIFGLLGGIVALYPNRVYVILPLMIPMRAAVLAVLMLSTHLFFILTPYGTRVAYDVHLFGGLTGFLFCGGLALRHRLRWRDVINPAEIPFACVEFETLAYRLAMSPQRELSEMELKRYQFLREALRFEDVPSVEEIKAHDGKI